MKIYVQFLNVHDGKIIEACGSDAVYILDGRNNRLGHIAAIMERMYYLRDVQKFEGYRVYRGTRFSNDNQLIVEWVRSGVNVTSGSLHHTATYNW